MEGITNTNHYIDVVEKRKPSFETSIPGRLSDFPARSRFMSHIQGCYKSIQGQSHKSGGWRICGLSFTSEGLYNKTQLDEAIIQILFHEGEIARQCRTLVDCMLDLVERYLTVSV